MPRFHYARPLEFVSTLTRYVVPVGVGTTTLLSVALTEGLWGAGQAIAQIEPIAGETNTQIINLESHDGTDQIDVQGGATSVNGKNLFHGFERFNVEAEQIINFSADRKIENIFSYVTGGASLINGTLQVSGGRDPDLYFINPSGILFGPEATLQLPGSFTATTASVLGFGSHYQLDLSSSDLSSLSYYKQLKGAPTYFDFVGTGAVIALNDLAASEDQTVSLIGGSTLNFEDGNSDEDIVITVVEDGSRVRVSQPGKILSIEFSGVENGFEPLSISELLTGSGFVDANEIAIDEDGTVRLIDESDRGNHTDDDDDDNEPDIDDFADSTPNSTTEDGAIEDETDGVVIGNQPFAEEKEPESDPQLSEPQPAADMPDIFEPVGEPAVSLGPTDSTDIERLGESPKVEAPEAEDIEHAEGGEFLRAALPESTDTENTTELELPSAEPVVQVSSAAVSSAISSIEGQAVTSQTIASRAVASQIVESALEESDRGATSPVLTQEEADTEAITKLLQQVESSASQQFISYLSLDTEATINAATLSDMQDMLRNVHQKNSAVRPALLYAYFVPDAGAQDANTQTNLPAFASPNDRLEIMVVSQDGTPTRHRHTDVARADVEKAAALLRQEVTSQFSRPTDYLPPAQQLYQWIIEPIESHLSQEDINSLGLAMDEGLRVLPLAALHDGNQFLIERYSIGLIPSFSLTSFDVGEAAPASKVLAMGASEFQDQPPLPAVEAELSFISEGLWTGDTFINERFTLENLKSKVASENYGIVHLATHAFFDTDDANNSYIQMWEEKLRLPDLQRLDLESGNIAMIILSACNTAIGDRASEYGFAGFALSAGSESAMASLWPVSDEGTLGFMTQFYHQLPNGVAPSEALRLAQVTLINGGVGIDYGRVYGPGDQTLANLPELSDSGTWDFSHPYYWSAFSLVGNPW